MKNKFTKHKECKQGENMIDKLKFLIDGSENNPKIKKMLLKVAELPENKQEKTLELIEMIIRSK